MDPILQENAIASAMNSIREHADAGAAISEVVTTTEEEANEVVAAANEVVAATNEVVTTTEEEAGAAEEAGTAEEAGAAADADAVLDAIVDAVILDDEEPEVVVPAVVPPLLETIIEENVSVPESITFKIPEPPANEVAVANDIAEPVNEIVVANEVARPANEVAQPANEVAVANDIAEPALDHAPANEVPPAAPSAQAELPKQTPSQAVLAVAEAVAVFAETCAAAAKTVSAAKTAAVATVDAISKVQAQAGKQATASAGAVQTQTAPVIKKYRAASYDHHDETYAKELTRIFSDYVDIVTQNKFMDFTDRLMREPRISRFCLLGAIGDYEKTTDGRKYPFPVIFTDAAFNYRPHQPCVIC